MIYFIRHGQTDWNVLLKCQGRKDVPLNEIGVKQAKDLKTVLKDLKIDAYFCSPLLRAMQTFEYAVGRKPQTNEIDSRIIERDFGEFEGFRRDEFDFKGFWNVNGCQTFKRAESIADIEKRATDFLNYIKQHYHNKNVVVISHGGLGLVLYALINGAQNDGNLLKIEMPHGSIIKMDNDKLY